MLMWSKNAEQELIRILQGLIRLDSSNPPRNERGVAEYIKSILDDNGIPSQIIEKIPNRSNIVAIVKGDDSEVPILLISHIDVVPVKDEDWSFDGFSGDIVDGFLRGRGTIDTKQLTAMELLALLLIIREKKPLKRTVIFIATADEEGGSTNGMQFLSEEYPQFFPDAWVLNEGGGFVVTQNGKDYRLCTCGEKGKFSVGLTMHRKDERGLFCSNDQMMSRINNLLHRLSSYESPEIITDVMDTFRKTIAEKEYSDRTIQNLWDYGIRNDMQILSFDFAGDDTSLADTIELKIDFKTIPGITEDECRELFSTLLGNENTSWEVTGFRDGYLSKVDCDFAVELKDISEKLDPETKFLPIIALGNTDGRFIAKDVFGYSPMLADMPFSKILSMIHNKDECVSLPSLSYGGRVIYEVLHKLVLEGPK
jgi:acetylornithine deacetylase/succinyl-diaminopimelate desuccinylase-like protein